MCEKCANIDYPIRDAIWTPCGGPASRYPGRRRPTPLSDEDHDGMVRINQLMAVIRRQQQTITALKEAKPEGKPGTAEFDGPTAE